MEKQKQSRRLLSLDALRGFDMFFIMGGASLFRCVGNVVSEFFFSGDRWTDGSCGVGRVDTPRHDFSAVSVHCRHLVSVLVGKAARTGEERVGYL